MKISELVFVGIKGSVVALRRTSGEQVWTAPLKGSEFVNLVLDSGRLFATCYGEIFCLDPLTGRQLWHNRLKGFGTGLATIAIEESGGKGMPLSLAEQRRREEAAAAASSASAAAASG
jgi:hypothetical protein